ncbi:MAG: type II secretion system major pseudopilin GspG [Thiothrix sp.]|nr:type II secretion system major pseudopilin GspG [Thiothrix sp.]HPE61602.1 type II secretion system major pseudopilin GspG [Thiolinea sp.]
MKMKRRIPVARAAGYTLLELLIVITIIGVLLGVAVVNMSGTPDEARIAAAKQEVKTLELALDMYRMHNAKYPESGNLKALVEKPADAKSYPANGYLKGKTVPADPWGNVYKYLNPGNRSEIDIYSLGPDGRESDDDIGNWSLD